MLGEVCWKDRLHLQLAYIISANKLSGHGADHPPLTSVEVKNKRIYTSTTPYAFMGTTTDIYSHFSQVFSGFQVNYIIGQACFKMTIYEHKILHTHALHVC
jgi:hypothetical protein